MAKTTTKAAPAKPGPRGLTAREFFALNLEGYGMRDAHFGTEIAYSTLGDIARGPDATAKTEERKRAFRTDTLSALEKWSKSAIAAHGVFISAARTAGFDVPSAEGAK